MSKHHHIVIVGGGSAGITVASRLLNDDPNLDIAIIDAAKKHYYQPLWTLVGAGAATPEVTEREEADVIPYGAEWIQEFVASFDPENNSLTTKDGTTISYDFLVVAAGIQINWDAIPGLKESVGKNGVCSNYSYETVRSTWDNIKNLKSGTAIFTHPNTPVKCGGAPQKICYLAEDYFRKHGVRDNINVVLCHAKDKIFAVEKYRKTLEKVIDRKGIDTRFHHDLKALRPDSKEAIFKHMESGDDIVLKYDMIHVSPPMSAPNFIAQSPIAGDDGWVDVDKHSLQHTRFPNVFAIGDCSNLPTSKTGAAIRKQAPALVENLLAASRGEEMSGHYDGYTSCPLVTGYDSMVLAEFNYDKQPAETFPFDQSKERFSMFLLKKFGLPNLYWHGMLKGRA